VESHRVYYKGEGGGFPQVRAVVSLVCPCCPWLVLAPKVLQLCSNHFVWVVCRLVWVTKAYQLFLVPSRSSNTPIYPSKCCELGSVLRLLLFRCFLLGLTFEPFKELGVSQFHKEMIQITKRTRFHKERIQITKRTRFHKERIQITKRTRFHKERIQITKRTRFHKEWIQNHQ